jgi:hypothetical protein
MAGQTGVLGHTSPGHKPLLVLLTPPGVETCLDAAGTLCSVGSATTAQFCSYHSHVDVGGTDIAYVVQPWSAMTQCDEPDVPALPANPTPELLAVNYGMRMVSPLSQAELGALVNPALNGWFALDGSEINDNGGCVPLGQGLDVVGVGGQGYWLQREFNNAGVIESDPNAQACTPEVALAPTFVVPSAINAGDVVQLDGSTTVSTLIVPRGDYAWNFGDGTTAIGPSVVHTYPRGGTYTIQLTVTDRGGNVRSVSQQIQVLGANGQPSGPPPPSHPATGLHARLALVPQGLRGVLRSGVAVRVTANEPADGIATVYISRHAARLAHIKTGRGTAVVIGRGTVTGIKNGTTALHVRLSRSMTAKLRHLRHVSLTLRLALRAANGDRAAIDAAGRY